MRMGTIQLLLICFILLLAACGGELTSEEIQASVEAGVAASTEAQAAVSTSVVQTVAAQSDAPEALATVDIPVTQTATSTPLPEDTATPPPTNTPIPTITPTPTLEPATETPVPTATAVPPTNTPAPVQPTQPPPPPTAPPNPVFGPDILLNDSFEGGWYNMWGLPELQLPNGWVFEWDEGPTGFGTEAWDQWYRPETRVLPIYQLPGHEQGLFVLDGDYTIKIFKGYGPISFRLYQDIALEAGTYKFTILAYPDLVMAYNNGNKVWAGVGSGEVRFITPDGGTGWMLPTHGVWNRFEHTFTLAQPATVRIGVGIRAKYGLINNGWFFDNWDLQRLEG